MNSLTILVLLALAIWWYKPLRVFFVQRTNRTVKVLLVVMPALFAARIGYTLYHGEQGGILVSLAIMLGLLAAWVGLVWLGNTLERRRPTKSRAPDLAALSRLPGMPRIPSAAMDPQVQRAARAAADAASQVDWGDVAASLGRTSGRWAARLRKSRAGGNSTRPR